MAREKLIRLDKQRKRIRVGTKYQASIPTRVKEDEWTHLFRVGCPIPVTWMKTINGNPIESNRSSGSNTRKSNNMSSFEVCVEEEMNLDLKNEGLHPVPSSFRESWSAIEHGTFLLGLYVFGNNFRVVKEFMAKNSNKGMGCLLSYYYGKFYKSQDYKRWLGWTRERKRTLNARKILAGLELHELVARLFANVIQEHRDSLVMLGRNYLGEKLSLTEFIFTLRDIVGINRLIEAVAIGQEERDLFQFPTPCYTYVVIQEQSTENRFSSVSNQEIVDILNGNVRLSKEKTRHIFCDLVWPRLVSKGWHRCQNSKHLVFFVPGVVDFSSTELEKGTHYYDSMTDVLSLVASKPHLLENEEIDLDLDLDSNQDLDNEKKLTSSLVFEAANETEPGSEEPLNLEMNQGLERLTILDTILDHDVDESRSPTSYITGSKNKHNLGTKNMTKLPKNDVTRRFPKN